MRAEKFNRDEFLRKKQEILIEATSSGIRIVANREIKHVEANDFGYAACQRYRVRP